MERKIECEKLDKQEFHSVFLSYLDFISLNWQLLDLGMEYFAIFNKMGLNLDIEILWN